VIPPEHDARFVTAMETILDTYAAPPPTRGCHGSASTKPARSCGPTCAPPPPMTAHHPRREDPEYRRQGSANLFLTVAPHLGWRQVRVSERRTQRDFAHAMRTLVDEDFPEADRIIVVRDHLNTHQRSSLYPTFPPAEAHRLARKLEFRFTPHPWLLAQSRRNRVECPEPAGPGPTPARSGHPHAGGRRLGGRAQCAGVWLNWQFTCAQARVRLAHLYPVYEQNTAPVTDYSG